MEKFISAVGLKFQNLFRFGRVEERLYPATVGLNRGVKPTFAHEPVLVQTFAELRHQFGAASWETQTLRGEWQSEGFVSKDNLARFFVDVPDRPEHREYFRQFKETLKTRFHQLDIWITSHPIDVI